EGTEGYAILHNEKQKDADLCPPIYFEMKKVAVDDQDSLVPLVTAKREDQRPAAFDKAEVISSAVMDQLDEVAAETIKRYYPKAWSDRQLATALAHDERIALSSDRIRKKYLPDLRENAKSRVHRHFDPVSNEWRWLPP
ncbi:MAG: hypothetical protein VW405_06090, partial [Rhodospirillaceae bacterium]